MSSSSSSSSEKTFFRVQVQVRVRQNDRVLSSSSSSSQSCFIPNILKKSVNLFMGFSGLRLPYFSGFKSNC